VWNTEKTEPFDADSGEVEDGRSGGGHFDESGQLAERQSSMPDRLQLHDQLVRQADEQEHDVGDGQADQERRGQMMTTGNDVVRW